MGRPRARTAPYLIGLFTVLVVVGGTACSPAETDTRTARGSVIEVIGDLGDVEYFTMVTSEGETLTLQPDPLGEFGFPLPHLREHLVSGAPIAVTYRMTPQGALVAVAIDDA